MEKTERARIKTMSSTELMSNKAVGEVESRTEKEELPTVLRLRGGGPPVSRGLCCMEDCTLIIKTRCTTCPHHVCLVDMFKSEGIDVCIHCKKDHEDNCRTVQKILGQNYSNSKVDACIVSEQSNRVNTQHIGMKVVSPDDVQHRVQANIQDGVHDHDQDGVQNDIQDGVHDHDQDESQDDIQDCVQDCVQDGVQDCVQDDVQDDVQDENDNRNKDSPVDFQRCLKCNELMKSPIPHLKKKELCKQYYIDKYQGSKEWINAKRLGFDDIKSLAKIFKAVKQNLRRQDITYRKAMNQDRKEKRREQRKNEEKCSKMFFEKLEESFSKKCVGCEAFLSPVNVETIPNIGDFYDEFLVDIDDGVEYFICKWCTDILEHVNNRKEFDGEDEDTKLEYETWAKENFSFREEILKMKKRIKENSSAGVRIFNDDGKRKTIIFPQAGKSDLTISVDEKPDRMVNCDPVVLLPQCLFAEDPISTLSRAEIELANRWFGEAHPINVLSVVMLDRLGTMKYKKLLRQKQNSEVKKGVLKNNNLRLNNLESLEGCLSEVKGSSDFLSKQKEDLCFRQVQNGFKNIAIKWLVFEGYSHVMSDPFLATAVLRSKGFEVKSIEKASDGRFPSRDFRVCCDDAECNPFVCTKVPHHHTPLEIMNKEKLDVDIMFVAKFMTEKIQSFVDQIVKPIAKEYALFLTFDRPTDDNGESSFSLAGNIWTEDLASFNSSREPVQDLDEFIPEILQPENLSKFFGGSGRVVFANSKIVPWNKTVKQDVTPPVLENVAFEEIESCREASVFEALIVCGRSQPLCWYSQQMLYINTDDPRKVRETKSE